MLINTDIIEKIAALFENKNEAEKDATALKKEIKAVITKSRVQAARVKVLQQKWDKKFAKPMSCIKKTYDYTVKKGDKLGDIAKRSNTTVPVIKRLNPMIIDEHAIFVGAMLKLPNSIQ